MDEFGSRSLALPDDEAAWWKPVGVEITKAAREQALSSGRRFEPQRKRFRRAQDTPGVARTAGDERPRAAGRKSGKAAWQPI
jgi:hypothetical protein